MSAASSLLTLLQLCDSAFPIGAYSQSWGFETFVQSGVLEDVASVQRMLTDLLWSSVAPLEGRACAIAWRCATNVHGDFEEDAPESTEFQRLNTTLTAMRWACETHSASLQMGDRLRRVAEASGITRAKLPCGDVHHCAAFGWLCCSLGIDIETACAAYLHTTCAAIVSACVRLVPLGHTDGQRLLTAMRAQTAPAVSLCLTGSLDELTSFAPLYESACVQHESLYSRLFQS